ncbi:ATP-binding cassette domain-containing protein [Streptacidiphilus sp. PB12-B1b]|uniref:ATP-binding cassette domain-containing protein n=1 Tax=Streptacidiphilus sp. PB12-B1b TaxID=2705012 RepID=UPI0015FA8254|nr:ATP-binding cassette domain-containing protein [Streptacidiphilus sp. PB12-B1b]QMU77967.1 ATP-binding cassette domain-containing protein [Streptacidiphilus sp. PB12-B1b]
MTPAIRIDDLAKSFGGTPAVRGVSLEVPAGTVHGLLGPNGAGKTTIVRMLATLVRPDRGTALVHGFDVVRQSRQVRSLIGLTGQYASVDEDISGWENLYLIGRLLNLSRPDARSCADRLLERFRLTEAGGRVARGYSGGMRRRLDLAASLIGRPRMLFLDEPTTGLDPSSRKALWHEVRSLADEGTTVLLTTQYMEEAEALADEITVIDQGRVIAAGTTLELRERIGGQTLRVAPQRPDDLGAVVGALGRAGLRPSPGERPAEDERDDVRVTLPAGRESDRLTAAVGALGASGIALNRIDTEVPSLDEVFLALTDVAAAPTESTTTTRSAA